MVAQIVEAVDVDNSGTIDFQEFLQMMRVHRDLALINAAQAQQKQKKEGEKKKEAEKKK